MDKLYRRKCKPPRQELLLLAIKIYGAHLLRTEMPFRNWSFYIYRRYDTLMAKVDNAKPYIEYLSEGLTADAPNLPSELYVFLNLRHAKTLDRMLRASSTQNLLYRCTKSDFAEGISELHKCTKDLNSLLKEKVDIDGVKVEIPFISYSRELKKLIAPVLFLLRCIDYKRIRLGTEPKLYREILNLFDLITKIWNISPAMSRKIDMERIIEEYGFNVDGKTKQWLVKTLIKDRGMTFKYHPSPLNKWQELLFGKGEHFVFGLF